MQQQAVVESSLERKGSDSGHTGKSYLFRNPFETCKNMSHQCCSSPLVDSQRTSNVEGRRSTAQPSAVSDHSGESSYPQDEHRVPESPLSPESVKSMDRAQEEIEEEAEIRHVIETEQERELNTLVKPKRKKRGLLSLLKQFTQGSASEQVDQPDKLHVETGPHVIESSFSACGRKVMAVAEDVEYEERIRRGTVVLSNATFLAAESTDYDTLSEGSMNLTDTSISETTMISMMKVNGSFSSPFGLSYQGSTLESKVYDDDASSFSIIPRTSLNSSLAQEGTSYVSDLSGRFGEFEIGYVSLEESGEGPEFDDTVSISSSQHEDMNVDMDLQDDTVSESDLGRDYSISSDSQEWCAETEDTSSVLQRSRAHNSMLEEDQLLHSLRKTFQTTSRTVKFSDHVKESPLSVSKSPVSMKSNPRSETKIPVSHGRKESGAKKKTQPTPPKKAVLPVMPKTTSCTTDHLCSRCGRKGTNKELQLGKQQQTIKKVTKKENPLSTCLQTYQSDENPAAAAAKVVVLLGKYGNRKGLRVGGLPPGPKDLKELQEEINLSAKDLDRLRTIINPNSDAVSAFQNEVARMMLEGADVPELNMDVEQFIAGYMKLNSPFYIDLIEDFFKSVCMDCFSHMERAGRGKSMLPAAKAVLRPRKPKTIAKNTNSRR